MGRNLASENRAVVQNQLAVYLYNKRGQRICVYCTLCFQIEHLQIYVMFRGITEALIVISLAIKVTEQVPLSG
jgi:hypothetical protein